MLSQGDWTAQIQGFGLLLSNSVEHLLFQRCIINTKFYAFNGAKYRSIWLLPRRALAVWEKKQAAYDERIRNAIEGKFGQGKRRFSLARIMAKLENTSRTAIAQTFLVINLSTWWRRVFCVFLCRSGKTIAVSGFNMSGAYASVRLRQKNLSLTRLEYINRSRSWFTIDYSASPK